MVFKKEVSALIYNLYGWVKRNTQWKCYRAIGWFNGVLNRL